MTDVVRLTDTVTIVNETDPENVLVSELTVTEVVQVAVAGPQGPPGPPGPAGTGAGQVWHQAVPSDTWLVTHTLSWYPSVTVVDSTGRVVVGDLEYTSPTTLTITFAAAFAGDAFLS